MGIVVGKLVKGLEEEIFPRVMKRKLTENNENPPKKSRRQDPIPSDNESPSTSKVSLEVDVTSLSPPATKVALEVDVDSLSPSTSKVALEVDVDSLSPSTSKVALEVDVDTLSPSDSRVSLDVDGDTFLDVDGDSFSQGMELHAYVSETRNTPQEALSRRSTNSNAVGDDGPFQTKRRTLDMFQARYQEQEKLGEGGFGCVFAGHRKADNLNVAIKHISQEDVIKHRDDTGKQIPMEVAVMLKLAGEGERHSAPIDLLDWYDLDQELILVLERPMPAVDLNDYIKAKGGYLMEKDAKVILRQVVDAAIDLQQRHIFHRDIKVNNLLIETSNKKAPRVRIIDFGVSCFSAEGHDAFRNFEGTHFPPEWHSQREYKAGPTTVYQIGGVLYDMLHQQSFGHENLYQQRRINWRFSENCRDFFKSCFQTDPDRRLTLQQLRNHLWLR